MLQKWSYQHVFLTIFAVVYFVLSKAAKCLEVFALFAHTNCSHFNIYIYAYIYICRYIYILSKHYGIYGIPAIVYYACNEVIIINIIKSLNTIRNTVIYYIDLGPRLWTRMFCFVIDKCSLLDNIVLINFNRIYLHKLCVQYSQWYQFILKRIRGWHYWTKQFLLCHGWQCEN